MANAVVLGSFGWLEDAVQHATGWAGLALIAIYSFLISFLLPLPSEVVLFAPLNLGLGEFGQYALIILVSGLGKAGGSVFAFHIGQEAKQSGPVIKALRRSKINIVEWSERKTVELARKWGYLGLAMALCVPFFPDTISIYAFSILEEDYAKFAAATFAGSVGRLLVTIALGAGVIALELPF
ncbi:YqaA family protein [Haladaptatus caseinilyticus]|uniref:YqaA family protein n=1 Tax=Haladaptatus caseinilyticus TaxID=2993314 RepID=UPI00224B556A|nr:VTT domain-containing protein [Haladaptatus caseinilyticus]